MEPNRRIDRIVSQGAGVRAVFFNIRLHAGSWVERNEPPLQVEHAGSRLCLFRLTLPVDGLDLLPNEAGCYCSNSTLKQTKR